MVETESEQFPGLLPDNVLGNMPLPVPVSGKNGNLKPYEVISISSDDLDICHDLPDNVIHGFSDPNAKKPQLLILANVTKSRV